MKNAPLLLNKKTNGWIQALVILIFIMIPGVIMWFFLSSDWTDTPIFNFGMTWLSAIGFIIYSVLIVFFLTWIGVVWLDVINFSLPSALTLMAVLVTAGLPSWSRAIIIIIMVLLTFPINMVTNTFIDWVIERKNQKIKKSN